MINLHEKKVLVTGGASGIGYDTLLRLLSEGCHVAVWDASEKSLEEKKVGLKDFEERIRWTRIDIADRKAVYEEAENLLQEWGRLDILINNAGVMRPGTFLEGRDDDWDLTLDVNLRGVLHTIRAFLPSMYERNEGHIVNISSAAGMLGVSGLSVYAASKWAVHGFTDSLREEAFSDGKNIRYTSIHPFYIATGLFEGARIKGLGNLLVPRVKSHDVIARAIVEMGLKRARKKVYRPRSLFLIDFLKGLMPYSVFAVFIRWLRVQESMNHHTGRKNP